MWQSELSDYEARLFAFLDKEVSLEPGERIQKTRYLRDRVEWLISTFKSSASRHPRMRALCQEFCETHPAISGDFGHWGELKSFVEFVAMSRLDYLLKSEVLFYAAALAAQQAEGLDESCESIPGLKNYLSLFSIRDRGVLLSTKGYLQTRYSVSGMVRIRSVDGQVSLQKMDGSSVARQAELILERAQRHGWQISPERLVELDLSLQLVDFCAVSRLEVLALFYSQDWMREGRTLGYSEFARSVFSVWLPNSLGLTLTYFCNASCGHCYNASGSNRAQNFLSWSEMRESLRQWVELGVSEIGISGGEPFLFPERVIEIVGGLRALGVKRIVPFSNGFWGGDEAEARKILEGLKNAGFGAEPTDQIKVSVGEFHQKDVSVENVFRLARLHDEILGRKMLLDVEQVEDPGTIKKLIWYAKHLGLHQRVDWKLRNQVSDSGRGRKLFASLPQEAADFGRISCPVKRRGALYPEGDWIYCTGTIHPKRHLKVGALGSQEVYEVLAEAQRQEKLLYLQFGSFEDYLSVRGSEEARSRLPKTLAVNSTPCSACRQVFGGGCSDV